MGCFLDDEKVGLMRFKDKSLISLHPLLCTRVRNSKEEGSLELVYIYELYKMLKVPYYL